MLYKKCASILGLMMRSLLEREVAPDWKEEDQSDCAERIVTEALTEDEFGNMRVEDAEHLFQWIIKRYLS